MNTPELDQDERAWAWPYRVRREPCPDCDGTGLIREPGDGTPIIPGEPRFIRGETIRTCGNPIHRRVSTWQYLTDQSA